MEVAGVCHCCLAEGLHKDLRKPYIVMDKKEVYSEMLLECFKIVVIPPEQYPTNICEVCINSLRSSLNFMHQVLNAERQLIARIKNGYISGVPIKNEPKKDKNLSDSNDYLLSGKDIKMKVEPKEDSDFSDSDDYFLADTVTATEISVEEIKKEASETRKSKSNKSKKKNKIKNNTNSEHHTHRKLRTIVLSTARQDKVEKSKRTITLAKLNIDRPKITFSWSKDSEKVKHRDNLTAILEYSNALPFKNKSLLGFTCAYCDSAFPDPTDLRSHTDNVHQKDKLDITKQDLTVYCPKLDITDLCCTICEERTDNLTVLKEHLVKIHKKVRQEDDIPTVYCPKVDITDLCCTICEERTDNLTVLKEHLVKIHKKVRQEDDIPTVYCPKVDITDLCCTICDEMTDNLTVLKEHLVKIHKKVVHEVKDHIMQFKLKKGEVYDCAMCSSTYETFKMLKQHMNIHYSNYCCTKCDAVFATKRSLSAHKNTHQEGSYKCEYCEKIFPSRSKKHYHVKMKHLGARNISNCPYCDEPFRSYYQRNQHLIKVHNSESQYKCNICNKSFILKSLLMYHIKKNHLMERNAQCTECGYRFFSKKALKAHMVKHTGERNYACEVCHKSYARKYTLREHMRIHNNDRRFKCDVCSMTFVQKCSLKSHLLSNHGISLAASEISTS